MNENKNIEKIEYERPRCKIVMNLPFRFFIAKRVRIERNEDMSLNPIVNPRP